MAEALNIKVSKQFGLNPLSLACPVCGKFNGFKEPVGILYRYECKKCKKITFYNHATASFSCLCGSKEFNNLGEQEAAEFLIPSIFLCEACKKIEKHIVEEVAKGGLRWHCDTCDAYGSLDAKCAFTVEFRKLYSNVTEVDFTGTGKCPNCGKL